MVTWALVILVAVVIPIGLGCAIAELCFRWDQRR